MAGALLVLGQRGFVERQVAAVFCAQPLHALRRLCLRCLGKGLLRRRFSAAA